MLAPTLVIVGAGILGLLGTLHLVYTLFTHKFDPRDIATQAAMRADHPMLTRRLTMWRAWIGFNASHSLGVMLFAAVYLVLAARHAELLRASPSLVWLAVAGGGGYLLLAQRYWFRTPLIGIAISTACFLGAALTI
jgi:hypothetical protein